MISFTLDHLISGHELQIKDHDVLPKYGVLLTFKYGQNSNYIRLHRIISPEYP